MRAAYILLGRSKGQPGRECTRSVSGLAVATATRARATAKAYGEVMAMAGLGRGLQGGGGREVEHTAEMKIEVAITTNRYMFLHWVRSL